MRNNRTGVRMKDILATDARIKGILTMTDARMNHPVFLKQIQIRSLDDLGQGI